MLSVQLMQKPLRLVHLKIVATLSLFFIGCGPLQSSFKSSTMTTNIAESPKPQLEKPEEYEREENYSNPFTEINGQFDVNAPEVRSDHTPHGEIKDQAVGTYNGVASRLENPSNLFFRELALGGKAPFKIMYPSQKTFFGTAEMVDMIEYLGHCVQSLTPKQKLLIGDISKEHGGQLTGHDSHRIGLDADIGYLDAGNSPPNEFHSMVNGDISQKIHLKEQLHLFEFAVMTQRVDRILVHPLIKNALCETAKSLGALTPGKEKNITFETLRRLTPEPNHGDHFHLRLKCSKSQPRCIPMHEPANKTGC